MKTPNILHIFVDQQRFDTIAALNNPIIKTPNLDRLVRSGVAFTNAYTPCPVCVAARCSMIYGKNPMNTGCYENTAMPDDENTFMHELTKSGYVTHGVGKCHFAPNAFDLKGFSSRTHQEEYVPENSCDEPYYDMLKEVGYDYVCEPNGSRGEMYYVPQISQLPEKYHPTSFVAQKSIEFIAENKDSDKPWYLFSSFIHPHPPFAPPNPWHKLYRASMMPLPNVPLDCDSVTTFVNKVQNRYKYRDFGIDNNLVRLMKAYYYACISFVDYNVGKILDYLEENNMTDNTMVVFTADHGEHLGDYNSFGKRTFHDSAAKIPMIVRLKGKFDSGKPCDEPVSLVDLAPTFLSTANITKHSMKFDGEDMYDILTGKSKREAVFGQHCYEKGSPIDENVDVSKEFDGDYDLYRASRATYMAVTKDYKYFYSAGDNKEFLFDKKVDPFETRNKAGVEFMSESLIKMRKMMIEHLKSGGETAGIEGDKFKVFEKYSLPDDPDAGLLIQDLYVPGVRVNVDVEGYDK